MGRTATSRIPYGRRSRGQKPGDSPPPLARPGCNLCVTRHEAERSAYSPHAWTRHNHPLRQVGHLAGQGVVCSILESAIGKPMVKTFTKGVPLNDARSKIRRGSYPDYRLATRCPKRSKMKHRSSRREPVGRWRPGVRADGTSVVHRRLATKRATLSSITWRMGWE
jgi:hypothetical protein